MTATDKREVEFNRLRAKYLKARAKSDALKAEFSDRYGGEWKRDWLTDSEQKKLNAAKDSVDAAVDSFFDFLDTLSPRNWRSGVPWLWVVEELKFAEAVKE